MLNILWKGRCIKPIGVGRTLFFIQCFSSLHIHLKHFPDISPHSDTGVISDLRGSGVFSVQTSLLMTSDPKVSEMQAEPEGMRVIVS